jgi:UDP-glucose 4-epimerase
MTTLSTLNERAAHLSIIASATLPPGSNVTEGVQSVRGDLRDAKFVESLWEHGRYDYIYHAAAYAAEGLSHFVRNFNYTTNLVASINLINSAVRHEVRCFVFTSSIAVYGANQVPMRKDMTPTPLINTET